MQRVRTISQNMSYKESAQTEEGVVKELSRVRRPTRVCELWRGAGANNEKVSSPSCSLSRDVALSQSVSGETKRKKPASADVCKVISEPAATVGQSGFLRFDAVATAEKDRVMLYWQNVPQIDRRMDGRTDGRNRISIVSTSDLERADVPHVLWKGV